MFKKCDYLIKKSNELKGLGIKDEELFKSLLLEFEGTPYLLGEETIDFCDCSGSVCAALSYTRNVEFRQTANFLFYNVFTLPVYEKNLGLGYVAAFFIDSKGKAVHVAGYCGNGYFMNVSSIEPNKISRKRTFRELKLMYSSFRLELRMLEEANEYV